MPKPLMIDLFAGCLSVGAVFARRGWRAVGLDLEHLPHHGPVPDGCDLVLQDALTLHGSQFKSADFIWASPPCQKYSWLAMPWSRSKSENSQAAKALRAKWEAEGPDNRLFETCFRIQQEAIEARRMERYCLCIGLAEPCARCDIPMVVENVRGAQEWVGAVFHGLDAWMRASREGRWCMGRSAWNFGSYHLWGDVPALMPIRAALSGSKNAGGSWFNVAHNTESGVGNNPVSIPAARNEEGLKGIASERDTLPDGTGGNSWFFKGQRSDPRDVRRNESGEYEMPDGTKIGGDWFSDPNSTCRKHSSRSNARKAASALIARIPEALAEHLATVYWPKEARYNGP